MSETTESAQTWVEVVYDFFSVKKSTEEEKYIKEQIKQIEVESKKNAYYGSVLLKQYFGEDHPKKDKEETSLDFQRRRIKALGEVMCTVEAATAGDVKTQLDGYNTKIQQIADKYAPTQWISRASKDAASVSFATHVSKLTHSKIDSPSIYDQVASQKAGYLTTSSLGDKVIDGAVAGNQFAPVFQFLELE